jgi:hypothetical protein
MPFERIVENRSLCTVAMRAVDDRHGRDVLLVVAKLSFEVTPSGAVFLAEPAAAVRQSDVAASEGPASSLRYPSDMVDEKPGTDVLLVGSAYPPEPGPAASVDVRLRVQRPAPQPPLDKRVRVSGRRVWMREYGRVIPGPAAALEPTPLLYELAYGGTDDSDPQAPLVDERNPAGRGVARNDAALVGREAPQLEDPDHPLAAKKPAPAAFGPIAAHWAPRAAWLGTCDEAWRRTRAPVRPLDYDPRHGSCASPGLWAETPLLGDEPVLIEGAVPAGRWAFRLPRYAPVFWASLRGTRYQLKCHLDTYLIDADAGCVELVWRVRVPIPRRAADLEQIYVIGEGEMQLRDALARATIEHGWPSRLSRTKTKA